MWQGRVVASRCFFKKSNCYVLFDENDGMELGNACKQNKITVNGSEKLCIVLAIVKKAGCEFSFQKLSISN